MDIILYIGKCLMVFLITWLGVRLIGKKSIAEMTSYDLAGIMLLTTVAAEPLVYKVVSKMVFGVASLAIFSIAVGYLSLKNIFYNFDMKPVIIVANGVIDYNQLKKSKMNLPLLLSELRVMGYYRIADIEYAIVEPMGKISVIPKSQAKPVTPKDLQIATEYEGLPLLLILDGKIQKENLKFCNLDEKWLMGQLKAQNVIDPGEVLLAQLDTAGKLHINTYQQCRQVPTLQSF